MSTSRATARKGLANLLTTALVGTGKPAQAVYAYQVGDFAGQSPVVVVSSGPMLRLRDTLGECYRSRFELRIYTFVLYADPASNWTESDAEDALDTIEAAIEEITEVETDEDEDEDDADEESENEEDANESEDEE